MAVCPLLPEDEMKTTVSKKWFSPAFSRSLRVMTRGPALRRARTIARRFARQSAPSGMIFLRELCRKPRAVGAVCPSSHYLARCMAKYVPLGDGLVVELGAGTGRVTRAVAEVLEFPKKRLWAVEQSHELAALLAKKFPEVNVVQGDAGELACIIPQNCRVDIIISSLPLRAFSPDEVAAVTRQWRTVLAPNGFVVQFTYALWRADSLRQYGFYESDYRIVWKNFPPARVQLLRKCP